MKIEEFDSILLHHITEIIEVSLEFIGNSRDEVDMIYIYGAMENQNPFFNLFFGINDTVIKIHEVNSVLNRKIDISDDTMFKLLGLGCEELDKIIEIFKDDNREVPTLMKITYSPKYNSLNNDIIYEPQYSNTKDKSDVDGFLGWYNEVKLEQRYSNTRR